MGSDSTIAAAEAIGYKSSGLDLDPEYFRLAGKAIPRLAALYPHFKAQEIEVEHFRVFRLFRGPNPVPRPFNDSTIQPFNDSTIQRISVDSPQSSPLTMRRKPGPLVRMPDQEALAPPATTGPLMSRQLEAGNVGLNSTRYVRSAMAVQFRDKF